MADEQSWENIFNPQPSEAKAVSTEPTAAESPAQPEAAKFDPTQFGPPQVGGPVVAATPEDPFAALFGASPATDSTAIAPAAAAGTFAASLDAWTATSPSASPAGEAPQSRRELRESEGHKRSSGSASKSSKSSSSKSASRSSSSGGSGGGYDGGYGGGFEGGYSGGKPKKRSRLWLKITLPILLVLGACAGVAAYAWVNYEDQVRELLGIELPTDYAGDGNGVEAVITIQSGEIGSDIATTLHDSGVTMTFDAFYELLLSLPEDPGFQPGNYSLEMEMSAQSALDALLDPENKITDRLLLVEGTILPDALEIIAETTGVSLAELQTASVDLASFGLPADAPSLEGYLFPATYQLDGGQTAHEILQLLVDTMFEHLDSAGVAVEDRHTVLTMAALIQREAGPNPDDFFKISRVFTNRLEQGMHLESDATVAYGAGTLDTVWTTDEDRADASNPYNTYANPGLPIGPIGLPGDLAIDAALHPADGPWLFFVPINLATGETVFSETIEEHEAAVAELHAWCEASEENASYCE